MKRCGIGQSGIVHASRSLPTRKSGPEGRFDSRFIRFAPRLASNEESACSSHDLRRHGLEIVFPHQAKRDTVAEFRIQAGEPGLDYCGIFFGQYPDQLEGEPQTLFGITVKLASADDQITERNLQAGERALLYVALTGAKRSALITGYGEKSPSLSVKADVVQK